MPYNEDNFDDEPPSRRTPRARKPRMGQVVKRLASRAHAAPGAGDFVKAVTDRERTEKAKRLQGGSNKGEKKGYGAASGRTEPPPVTEDQLP